MEKQGEGGRRETGKGENICCVVTSNINNNDVTFRQKRLARCIVGYH